jgi:dethiobiotin synthetase
MIFITGTDTNIGKTLVSSWLCLHSRYAYFKPIQTGVGEGRDSDTVQQLSDTLIYPEAYVYQAPVSPHYAAELENEIIDISSIQLPTRERLIVEGAGGVLVPINDNVLMVDLMAQLNLPVILVSSSRLGTINHTLLSLEALAVRELTVLGVIMTGESNQSNREAIERYGHVEVLAHLPWLSEINQYALKNIPLSSVLHHLLN